MKSTCVIGSLPEKAATAYAEAFAAAYRLPFFTMRQARHLSMSRFSRFLTSDDPDSFGVNYLIDQFPGCVSALSTACDGYHLSSAMKAVKDGRMANLIIPSKTDVEALRLSMKNVRWGPVDFESASPVVVYGLTLSNPRWLTIINNLTKCGAPVMVIPPFESEIMEMLKSFPLNFSVCQPADVDKAIFCAKVFLYEDVLYGDRNVAKALAFGRRAIPISEISNADKGVGVLAIAVSTEKSSLIADVQGARKNLADVIAPDPVKHLEDRAVFLQKGFSVERKNKLLIKFPTRQRPKKFYKTFREYCRLLGGIAQVEFIVSIDDDDETMHPVSDVEDVLNEIIQCVCFDKTEKPSVQVFSDRSNNKIHAYNRDVEKASIDWDMVFMAQDDMIPQIEGWDDVLLMAMEKYFPSTDGVLWIDDGYVGRRLNTSVVMGRAYYDRFGWLYNPVYEGMWCDNELMFVANRLGRQAYIDWTVVKHEHPQNNPDVSEDALYEKYAYTYDTDQTTFRDREDEGFGVEQRVLLSILIPTLESRRSMRTALVQKIQSQADAISARTLIEVLIDEDKGEKSIGQKRTDLVKRAKGEYVLFLDDDDDVLDVYVESLIANLSDGRPDCVTFGGTVFEPDGNIQLFSHTLLYSDYETTRMVFTRPPNHLNAIKREIALNFPFVGLNFGEDTDFATRIASESALKSERYIPLPMYLYRPMLDGASYQLGVQTEYHEFNCARTKSGAEKTQSNPPKISDVLPDESAGEGPKLSRFKTRGIKADRSKPKRKSARREHRRER